MNTIPSIILIISVLQSSPSIASAFAAKKKTGGAKKVRGRRGNTSSTSKGFGQPPPTFDEIVAGLKDRLPRDASSGDCPCSSGKTYGECCQPYHLGRKSPQSPREVLQSRYSAFAYRLPAYIIDTTHKECRDWREDRIEWLNDLDKAGMFDSYDFIKLEPGPTEAGSTDDEGYIEFKVQLMAKSDTIEGKGTVISERSRFLFDGDPPCWRYAGGDVRSDVSGLNDVVLNK
mmetsp:Transcript_34575/g.75692  ORF Transcript_34575/g.75692 Transcript_34575/m.75692 type:complete len:230 (+) Transcript_34575:127-816(+)